MYFVSCAIVHHILKFFIARDITADKICAQQKNKSKHTQKGQQLLNNVFSLQLSCEMILLSQFNIFDSKLKLQFVNIVVIGDALLLCSSLRGCSPAPLCKPQL